MKTLQTNHSRLSQLRDRKSGDLFAAAGSEDLTLLGEVIREPEPMANFIAQVSREEPELGELF